MSDFITTDQAAKIIGISRQAVVKAIRAGNIEAFRVGRSYNVKRKSAEVYQARRQRRKSNSPRPGHEPGAGHIANGGETHGDETECSK